MPSPKTSPKRGNGNKKDEEEKNNNKNDEFNTIHWDAYVNEKRATQIDINSKEITSLKLTGQKFYLDYIQMCSVLCIELHPCLSNTFDRETGDFIMKKKNGNNKDNSNDNVNNSNNEMVENINMNNNNNNNNNNINNESIIQMKNLICDSSTVCSILLTLKTCHYVTTLNFYNADLNWKGMQYLIELLPSTAISYLSIDFNPFLQFMMIMDNDNDIDIDNISSSKMNSCTNSRKSSKSSIATNNNNIRSRTTSAISTTSTTSTSKSKSKGKYHDDDDDDPMKRFLTDLLGENSVLTTCSLRGNGINDYYATHIAHVMKTNTVTQMLNLHRNKITSKAIPAFCELLSLEDSDTTKENSGSILKALHLSSNFIDDSGIIQIGQIMSSRVNYELQILNLSYNQIGIMGLHNFLSLLSPSSEKEVSGSGVIGKENDDGNNNNHSKTESNSESMNSSSSKKDPKLKKKGSKDIADDNITDESSPMNGLKGIALHGNSFIIDNQNDFILIEKLKKDSNLHISVR